MERGNDVAQVMAIFVGGPYDGETEEIEAAPSAGDPPGVVRVYGFELWPNMPFGPSGRYEPDTSGGAKPVPFIWQGYTPEEQKTRRIEAERNGQIHQLSFVTRLIVRVFWGTPIVDWIARRDQRQWMNPIEAAKTGPGSGDEHSGDREA